MSNHSIRLIPPQGTRTGNGDPFLVTLGRHGDLINALPIAACLSKNGKQTQWVVSDQFAQTLEGASYVTPIPVPCDYSKPHLAIQKAKAKGYSGKAMVAQAYGYFAKTDKKTSSYQLDGWVAAGVQKEFGYWPTVFDRRSQSREAELVLEHLDKRPTVLIAADSVSSPMWILKSIIPVLRERFPDVKFIDMSTVKAHRVYDLLALMDRAMLLVTVDTMHLHLSRASGCPVFAVINDGWHGSVRPPGTVGGCSYAAATAESLLHGIGEQIRASQKEIRVCHVTDSFYPDDRHLRAKQSCDSITGLFRWETKTTRNATDIGHDRKLPYLKDILGIALAQTKPGDAIIWTNSDIALDPAVLPWARRMVRHGMVTMRRNEPGHCGRDLVLFEHGWLQEHFHEIPDYIIGAPVFDLGLACMARYHKGIKSRMANMGMDFPPCDALERICLHEPHPQTWINDCPAGKHNGACFRNWLNTYAPDMGWIQ
jgi:hypothetical protein